MALSATHRSSLHRSLAPLVGEQEAEALLDQFPARSDDDPASEGFVREQIGISQAALRHEIGVLRAEMHHEIGTLRSEMHQEIGKLRAEMHHEIGTLRSEMHQLIGDLRAEMHSMFRRQTIWTATITISAMTATSAINAAVVVALT